MNPNDFIGGAKRAELTKIAGSGTIQDTDDEATLWDPSWVQAFTRWESQLGTGHLILVSCDTPSLMGTEQSATKIFDFADEQTAKSGIYYVGRTATSHAWRLDDSGSDFQADCARLSSLKINNTNLMIVGRKVGQILFYIGDIDEPRARIVVPLREPSGLSEARLLEVLSEFEQECWSVDFRKKIWVTAQNWIPVERAEWTVQQDLLLWFRATFRTYSVLPEVDLPIGRADLTFIPKEPSVSERAVVELKVVRAFSSTGDAVSVTSEVTRILGGRLQAAAYAITLGAAIRILCAFDLRKDKVLESFAPIAEACKNESVTFRSYAVLNASSAVQAALVAASKTN